MASSFEELQEENALLSRYVTMINEERDALESEMKKIEDSMKKLRQENIELVTEKDILQVSNQELESHKSKRLAARSEMIGLAQVFLYNFLPSFSFYFYQYNSVPCLLI